MLTGNDDFYFDLIDYTPQKLLPDNTVAIGSFPPSYGVAVSETANVNKNFMSADLLNGIITTGNAAAMTDSDSETGSVIAHDGADIDGEDNHAAFDVNEFDDAEGDEITFPDGADLAVVGKPAVLSPLPDETEPTDVEQDEFDAAPGDEIHLSDSTGLSVVGKQVVLSPLPPDTKHADLERDDFDDASGDEMTTVESADLSIIGKSPSANRGPPIVEPEPIPFVASETYNAIVSHLNSVDVYIQLPQPEGATAKPGSMFLFCEEYSVLLKFKYPSHSLSTAECL